MGAPQGSAHLTLIDLEVSVLPSVPNVLSVHSAQGLADQLRDRFFESPPGFERFYTIPKRSPNGKTTAGVTLLHPALQTV